MKMIILILDKFFLQREFKLTKTLHHIGKV